MYFYQTKQNNHWETQIINLIKTLFSNVNCLRALVSSTTNVYVENSESSAKLMKNREDQENQMKNTNKDQLFELNLKKKE